MKEGDCLADFVGPLGKPTETEGKKKVAVVGGGVGIADADNLNYMLTLPVEDAGKIDGAASLSHMMNANTFTCGAFHVTSKDDVETVASDLRDAIQSKQWMCGFPDKLVIFTYDQYVVSLYGDEELVNTFRDKFTATYSDSTIAYDEAIL